MEQYLVGAATIDITPKLTRKVYLAGFAPNRTAKGVLHPLSAGALYIRDNDGSEVCFVSLDLIGFPNHDVGEIRKLLAGVVPGDRLVVCSTHTHSGPDTLGLWGPAILGLPYRSGVDPKYVRFVVESVAKAVKQAKGAAAPAVLKAGSFEMPPGWVRNERKGGGAYPHVVVLFAESRGQVVAGMVNLAAHPEALWEKNRRISPDYPFALRMRLRELGVGAPLFFSGPLGAMLTPDVPLKAGVAERERYIANFGRMVAERALDAMQDSRPLSGPVKVAMTNLSLPNSNKRFEWARRLGLLRREISGNLIDTQVCVGRIGELRFATVPGEPSPEVGGELLNAMESGDRMILALGLDELGYIIPPSFFERKEYAYEQSMSLGPHVAPVIVEAVRRLMQSLCETPSSATATTGTQRKREVDSSRRVNGCKEPDTAGR